MQAHYDEIKQNLNRVQQALENSDMGEINTHLLILQKQLQATPHLVDMMLPEDIGVLVNAERKRMTQDILLESMPKTRKGGAGKRRAKKPTIQLDLASLSKIDASDF